MTKGRKTTFEEKILMSEKEHAEMEASFLKNSKK